MKSKKIMAVALTATMVVGSNVTVFAEDANSATGEGTAFEHVDKEITSVTLPTTAEVADVFDYYIDPERLINDAGTLADGTTAVTGNSDGVYFKNAGTSTGTSEKNASVTAYSIGGTSAVTTGLTVTVPNTTAVTGLSYKTVVDDGATKDGWYDDSDNEVTVTIADAGAGSVPTPKSGDTITVEPYQAAQTGSGTTFGSSSDAVTFEGKNSVDVDVSVAASVSATAGEKDITLVKDAAALAAAKTPALLMKLKVGSDEKAITSSGATASAKIEGVSDNFTVATENGKYVYKIRPDENNGGTALDPWNSTTVQLIGKTNTADVPAGTNALTAPQINLTWTIVKHTSAYVSATNISATNHALTLSMPTGVSISKVELTTSGSSSPVALTKGTHYTISGTTLDVVKCASSWAGGTITITYSDGHTDTIKCQ